jgi:hypothetical protein
MIFELVFESIPRLGALTDTIVAATVLSNIIVGWGALGL